MDPAASWNPGMASCSRRNALASQSFAPGLWTSHGGAHLRTGSAASWSFKHFFRLQVDKASMQLRCVPTASRCIVFFFSFHPEILETNSMYDLYFCRCVEAISNCNFLPCGIGRAPNIQGMRSHRFSLLKKIGVLVKVIALVWYDFLTSIREKLVFLLLVYLSDMWFYMSLICGWGSF